MTTDKVFPNYEIKEDDVWTHILTNVRLKDEDGVWRKIRILKSYMKNTTYTTDPLSNFIETCYYWVTNVMPVKTNTTEALQFIVDEDQRSESDRMRDIVFENERIRS